MTLDGYFGPDGVWIDGPSKPNNCNSKGEYHDLYSPMNEDGLRCTRCDFQISGLELMQNGFGDPNFGKVAPSLPATRVALEPNCDEFGFPTPAPLAVSREDMELIKRFLGNLKDSTNSRGILKTLTDLLGRLPS